MALDGTYAGLQASIAQWIDRTDLTAVIPDFISLFELQANQERAIRTLNNKTSTTLTTVAGQNYVSLPSDYLSVESLVNISRSPVDVVEPFGTGAELYASFPSAISSQQAPKGYLPLAGKLELGPVPDAAYTLRLYYYQKVPALATYGSNWLLTNYPNLYLFGSLVAAEAYLGSDPRIQTWGTMYDNFLQKLEGSTERAMYGGAALQARVDIVL